MTLNDISLEKTLANRAELRRSRQGATRYRSLPRVMKGIHERITKTYNSYESQEPCTLHHYQTTQ